MILDTLPYVDEDAFAGIRADWSEYVRRMAEYGNNGIVVPVFLELVTLDRVPAVYAGTDFPARHRALRDRFRELFRIARDHGVAPYLATDMVPLTPPLERYFAAHGGLAVSNPVVWETYRAVLDELLGAMPEVAGVVVRTGDAGALYHRDGWDYGSEFLVGTVAGLHAMLEALLPAFDAHGRTLILRSWTVGVGELGDLHTDPAEYQRAFSGVTSPNLIVSTKLQAGDFYRPLPINPTLLGGPERRIIELQARREFEGFGAFPN
jgi:hypothetical protein